MKVLRVEGRDEVNVITKLTDLHHFSLDGITIKGREEGKGGTDTLLQSLKSEIQEPGLSAFGLVLDADQKRDERWQSLTDRLKKLGYINIPPKPDPTGTILYRPEGRPPAVGIWIMPNNQIPGVLEDFIALLIPNKDSSILWQYAQYCVANIPVEKLAETSEAHVNLSNASHKSKALIHTYLAWQKAPGRQLSQAIAERKCAVNAQAEDAKTLIDWLRRLFIEPNPNLST